jgi:hypothetical protein
MKYRPGFSQDRSIEPAVDATQSSVVSRIRKRLMPSTPSR